MPHIFPTIHRDKHSKHVAFPIGAEAVSRAFDGVPQHDRIGCHFYAGNLQNDLGRQRFHILHAMYRKQERQPHHAQSAGETGVFDARWSVTVMCVPLELRATIRTLLLDDIIPTQIRPWLVVQAAVEGQTGRTAIMVEYDRDAGGAVVTQQADIRPSRSR